MNEAFDAARAAIPVLRFQAGPLHLGIAAEDVQEVVAAGGDEPHIATIFGVHTDLEQLERRVISVAGSSNTKSFSFTADAPVEVVPCRIEDVLSLSSGVTPRRWRPIMGFAQIGGHTVMLLDILSVAEKILALREQG